jgi:hypothetical protein
MVRGRPDPPKGDVGAAKGSPRSNVSSPARTYAGPSRSPGKVVERGPLSSQCHVRRGTRPRLPRPRGGCWPLRSWCRSSTTDNTINHDDYPVRHLVGSTPHARSSRCPGSTSPPSASRAWSSTSGDACGPLTPVWRCTRLAAWSVSATTPSRAPPPCPGGARPTWSPTSSADRDPGYAAWSVNRARA